MAGGAWSRSADYISSECSQRYGTSAGGDAGKERESCIAMSGIGLWSWEEKTTYSTVSDKEENKMKLRVLAVLTAAVMISCAIPGGMNAEAVYGISGPSQVIADENGAEANCNEVL